MRVFIKLLFLTLVSSTLQSVAAPNTNNEIEPSKLDATPISGPLWKRDQSPYHVSVYMGYSGGNFFDNDKTLSTSVFGFRFSQQKDEDHAWDFHADIHPTENLIGIAAGRRTFIFSTTDWVPYYKLAAGTYLKADNALANFAEIKRWQFRASGGSANLFNWNQLLYAEAGVGLAVVGWEYFTVLGFDFNF